MPDYSTYSKIEGAESGPVIFGKDISKIPCFRDSWLYGISAGLVGGLVTFMGTSRPQFATKAGIYSLFGMTIGYWGYCRYHWMKEVKSSQAIRDFIKAHNEEQDPLPPKTQNQPDLEILSVNNKL